jgi:hypothetical protein
MRKIIVGAQVSMDGVMQAPGAPADDIANVPHAIAMTTFPRVWPAATYRTAPAVSSRL